MILQQPSIKNITIALDIDDTIATGFEEDDISKIEKQHPWVPIFRRKGLYLHALVPHIIHLGVPEFIRFLDNMSNIRLSFFSSGIKERNEIFVKELLCLSLGQQRFEAIRDKVIVCSRNDLEIPNDMESRVQREYYGFCSGNKTKNLNKILRDKETLDWSILIDDDPSYAHYGQEKNVLKIPCAWEFTFSRFHRDPECEEKFHVNHIFYACGIICTLLEIAKNEPDKPLSELLFEMQYKENNQQNMANSKMIFNHALCSNQHYYNIGLNKLREINPELSFWDSSTWIL